MKLSSISAQTGNFCKSWQFPQQVKYIPDKKKHDQTDLKSKDAVANVSGAKAK